MYTYKVITDSTGIRLAVYINGLLRAIMPRIYNDVKIAYTAAKHLTEHDRRFSK